MDLFNKHEDQLGRGLTYDLWKNFPAHEILTLKDSNVGVGCKLDPGAPPYAPANAGAVLAGDGVKAFTDLTGTITGLTKAQYDGGQGFRMLASADNEAAELQFCGGAEPFIVSDTAADIKEWVWETHFRLDTITADDLAFFAGFASAQILDGDMIADNGADVADLDMLGFFHQHGDTTGLDVIYQKAGNAFVVHEADWGPTLAVDTWYILGMRYVPTVKKVELYWGTGDRSTTKLTKDDNPILSTDIDDATFPDGDGLCPTFAIKGGHADDKTFDVRTFAAAVRSYSAD